MKTRLLSTCLFLLVVLSGQPTTAAPPAASPGQLRRLSARAFMFVSDADRSANGALFVGSQAALVVDPGLSPLHAQRFLAAVRKATDRPIRYVVLTHWHPDHSLGAVCLEEPGAKLLAHPRTRRALAEHAAHARQKLQKETKDQAERQSLSDCRFHLPEPLLHDKEVFDLGDHQIEVQHLGPAHTTGDVIVWSPAERVLATGDLFLHDASPAMGEGSTGGWLRALDALLALSPRQVIPGHFAPGQPADLLRFRSYLQAQRDNAAAAAALAKGAAIEELAAQASFPQFRSFRQYPQYEATFADNARAVARELSAQPALPGQRGGFTTLAVLDVGQAPHQIVFSADGRRAFVAAAGSDRITEVDVAARKVVGARPVAGTPLGVAVLPDGSLAASLFKGGALKRLGPSGPAAQLPTGDGPSLFVGPLPDGRLLFAVEEVARLRLLDPRTFRLAGEYATGKRPFPPAFTSDGRKALVPSYDDGTVTIVDLWNQRVAATVPIGPKLSGGVVLPGDSEYAVAVRGQDRIAFVSTAEHREVDSLREGIGQGPFSVVASPDGRYLFVNNTGSHDVSVIELGPEPAARRVVARVPVGEIPIVLAVHPSGDTLWVSCEGAHRLHILSIPKSPPPPPAPPPAAPTEVAVLGMIHGEHRKSSRWGLDAVRQTLRRLAPDVVCAEIPPDRWPTIWKDFAERGVIEDARIKVFPEYTEVLLPLAAELGFAIEPCAAWTKEMSDLRDARLKQYEHDPAVAAQRAEYERRSKEVEARHAAQPIVEDDPRVIHSDLYDRRTKEELALYDQYQNDWIGPGGWTNINKGHFRLIDKALKRHRGQRVVITFGAGHKYWFLEQLRARPEVKLLEVAPFLPAPEAAPPRRP